MVYVPIKPGVLIEYVVTGINIVAPIGRHFLAGNFDEKHAGEFLSRGTRRSFYERIQMGKLISRTENG